MSQTFSPSEVPVSPPPARPPDPGSRRAGLITLVLTLVLYPLVFAVQHAAPPEPEKPEQGVLQPAGGDAGFDLTGRALLKLSKAFGDEPTLTASLRGQFDKSAGVQLSPADKLRTAIVKGELVDSGAALDSLDTWEDTSDEPDEQLATDRDLLRKVYKQGSASLSDAERERLETRFGWYGRLALVHDLPRTSAERSGVLGGGVALIVVILALVCWVVVAFVAGIVLFIVALVKLGSGRLQRAFAPAPRGGSVYLEIFTVLLGGFLVLRLLGAAFESVTDPLIATRLTLVLQWLLVGVVFWPRLRRVPWERASRDLGLHHGRGVLREIGAGVVGYLAGVPLLAAAAAATYIIVIIQQLLRPPGESGPLPTNPVVELLQHAGLIDLVILFTLATIWAPIVEETVFRGALYRWLRARTGVLVSGVVCATLFGAMHGYEVLMLLPVISLGFIFAMIREWRGSLIAPMTAHALHNGTALTVLVAILTILK